MGVPGRLRCGYPYVDFTEASPESSHGHDRFGGRRSRGIPPLRAPPARSAGLSRRRRSGGRRIGGRRGARAPPPARAGRCVPARHRRLRAGRAPGVVGRRARRRPHLEPRPQRALAGRAGHGRARVHSQGAPVERDDRGAALTGETRLHSTDRARAVTRLRALAEEQAALRRVATLVASGADPAQLFARVCAEVGAVLGVRSTNLTRFEDDGTQTVLAGWSEAGAPVFPVGSGVPVEGSAAVAQVRRHGRTGRVDDYTWLKGELPQQIRAAGIASAVAAPIKVGGSLWGAVVASSGRPNSFPPDTERRVAGFAELVADALASADAREKLEASRARIVEAGDAERRRLERNIHDGAQQRLVSLALALGAIQIEL